MPIYTVKEIAGIIGKPPKTIETYVSRKKLVKNTEKKIDSSNHVNEVFLAKFIIQQKTVQAEIPLHAPESKQDQEKKNGAEKGKLSAGEAMMKVEYAIKKLNAEKIQKDIQLKDIEIKKKNNELVDLEQTMSIVRTYSESIKKLIAQDVQLLIQDICSRYSIPSDKAGKYGLKVIELINQASNESIAILNELEDE